MDDVVAVTFSPAGLTVLVPVGTLVVEAARRAGVLVPAPCGGRGVCGSCGVRVLDGELAPPDEDEASGLARAPHGVRLACRARIAGPVELRPLAVHAGTGAIASEARVVPTAVSASRLVAGVDLGTTTVAAVVVDAATGRELSRAAVPNRQQSYGADILSRLAAALGEGEIALSQLAWSSIRDALSAALGLVAEPLPSLASVVVAGNTAMSALVAGADVARLAVYPFEIPELPTTLDASELGFTAAQDAIVTLLPPIAGFVGGDALAGVIAGGLCDADAPTLLVDVGTNAEVLLAGVGPIRAASAAAGPAFEGAGISCGGPAAPGAVESVRLGEDGSVDLTVIGGGAPAWVSGSGLVSAVAELVRRGHVTEDGLLVAEGPLASRVGRDEGGVLGVVLDEASGLRLTQLDIRALQLAKAAVRVAVERVLNSAGVAAVDVDEVRVAGAFGGAMEPADLADLGVVPAGLARCMTAVGNTALEGAAMIALDEGLLSCAREAAAGAVQVDLASDPGFSAALMAATRLARY